VKLRISDLIVEFGESTVAKCLASRQALLLRGSFWRGEEGTTQSGIERPSRGGVLNSLAGTVPHPNLQRQKSGAVNYGGRDYGTLRHSQPSPVASSMAPSMATRTTVPALGQLGSGGIAGGSSGRGGSDLTGMELNKRQRQFLERRHVAAAEGGNSGVGGGRKIRTQNEQGAGRR